MKFLKCLICEGEMEIIGNEYGVNKIVKCLHCGFTNFQEKKQVEVYYSRRNNVKK